MEKCIGCGSIDIFKYDGKGQPLCEHWLMGCPRKSEEEIQELERLDTKVVEARAALEQAIESEYKSI